MSGKGAIPCAEHEPVVATPCVLLVDDEECILHTTRLILESRGYVVVTATNAEEAAALLSAFAIDIAIVDFGTAWRDGDFLPAVIKASHPAVTSIVLSDDSEAAQHRDGVDVLLAKPAHPLELLHVLETAHPV